ncbi:hypothetical protein BKA70DRAFT_1429694 [Coprinopsis sp. MPI-PUGE-AT-0042]|nr:hypothetical protein BKA70DRAFT_1429694 [Coprinopsis sp. MPI-PUGE-AT-0042]
MDIDHDANQSFAPPSLTVMSLNPQLEIYLKNNGPLPEHLQKPLHQVLAKLDGQRAAYDRERRGIAGSIDARRSLIWALEREIETLERMEERLLASQVALESQQTLYRGITAPIRGVPPEIVASIIYFATEGQRKGLGDYERSEFLRLRSVCRLWRITSFSTPSLWRAVEINMATRGVVASKPRAMIKAWIWNRLSPWLSRAGDGAPVCLDFYGSTPTVGIEALDFVAKSGFNIATLDFTSSLRSCRWDLLSLENLGINYEGPLPVKRLTIDFRISPVAGPVESRSIPLTNNFPKLVELRLWQLESPPLFFPLTFAHSTLSHLQLKNVMLTPEQLIALLSELPQLRELRLQGCIAQPSAAHLAHHRHPTITRLYLITTFPEELLTHLVLPELRHMVLECPPSSLGDTNSGVGELLGAFLERCRRRVTLSIFGLCSHQLLQNILRSSTTVDHLKLSTYLLLEMDSIASCGHRHLIPIPPGIALITLHDKDSRPKLDLIAFKIRSRLAEGQVVLIRTPNDPVREWPYTLSNTPLPNIPELRSQLVDLGACPHVIAGSYGD